MIAYSITQVWELCNFVRGHVLINVELLQTNLWSGATNDPYLNIKSAKENKTDNKENEWNLSLGYCLCSPRINMGFLHVIRFHPSYSVCTAELQPVQSFTTFSHSLCVKMLQVAKVALEANVNVNVLCAWCLIQDVSLPYTHCSRPQIHCRIWDL